MVEENLEIDTDHTDASATDRHGNKCRACWAGSGNAFF
jgi:hypothetical protein